MKSNGLFLITLTALMLMVLLLALLQNGGGSFSTDSGKSRTISSTVRNPAAIYCVEIMGYHYRIVQTADGGQKGICQMPDKEECEEWDFFAGTCGQRYSYCALQGYRAETRSDGRNPFAPRYAVCVSPDGKEVGQVTDLSGLEARLDDMDACDPIPFQGSSDSHDNNPGDGHRFLPPVFSRVEDSPPSLPSLREDSRTRAPSLKSDEVMSLPTSFDWRNYQGYNWLTGVKNQGPCGSCWAFATVGVVEAYYNITFSNPDLDLDLAEQELVSCSGAGSCSGGSSSGAMWYIRNNGIVDENCMPYTASDSSCARCGDWQSRKKYVDELHNFSPNRLSIQQSVVQYGPLYVYMGIGSEYGGYFDSNRIYRCTNDSGINHAVVIVGYDDSGEYWIVRNSWGAGWNGDGYFRVGYGECAIDSTYAGYAYNLRPTGQIVTPSDGDFLNSDSVYIEATASDNHSVAGVLFFAWYDEDWHYINYDANGSDGYQAVWDVSGLSDRSGIWLDAVILDRLGNRWDALVGNLTLDRTPPIVSLAVSPMYGDAPFRDFYIHWQGSDLSGIADYDIQYRDGPEGIWEDLLTNTTDTRYRFIGIDGHTYYFRARARDLAGNRSTYAGGDGDVSYTVQVCETDPDAYEADDIADTARWIATDGRSQFHNIHAEGDQDWIKFYAAAGVTYTLVTTNTGGHADTVLYLYDTDGSTIIDFNDDYPEMWPASLVEWRPLVSGIYYAMVNHWDEYAYGCTTEYGLAIFTNDTTAPTGSISINHGATYAASRSVTLTLTGQDTGTGIDQVMISNDSDFSDTSWISYTTWVDWTLSSGDGIKTVYARFRDRAGNMSEVYSDTIVLDTIPPTGRISIQDDATVVTHTQVTLLLSASDASGVTHMRLKSSSSDWGDWVPFATSYLWILPARPGEYTVCAQFRDPAGNVSDSYCVSLVYQFPHHVLLPLVMRGFHH